MKQSIYLLAFKNEMRNYLFYKSKIAKLEELVERCYDMLGGVRAIDTSKEPIHSPPNKDVEYRIRDEIEKHLKNISITELRLKEVDDTLQKIKNEEMRGAIVDVYINGCSITKVSEQMFLSPSGLAKSMNKELKRVIKELI